LDTKTKIYEAATRLFFSQGYEKTTLRMIGEEVGIAHVSILSHYDNKMAIAAATFEHYIMGLQQKCQELFQSLPSLYHERSEYYRELLWWTLHFKLMSDNRAFREFFISYNREGPVVLVQSFISPDDAMEHTLASSKQANDFVLMSQITAIDANLASLIGFGMIDFVQAARLIMLHGAAIGFTHGSVPTEQEIREFADEFLAAVEVDILNDFLLKSDIA